LATGRPLGVQGGARMGWMWSGGSNLAPGPLGSGPPWLGLNGQNGVPIATVGLQPSKVRENRARPEKNRFCLLYLPLTCFLYKKPESELGRRLSQSLVPASARATALLRPPPSPPPSWSRFPPPGRRRCPSLFIMPIWIIVVLFMFAAFATVPDTKYRGVCDSPPCAR
jgi:hypothetical protein